jgi:hypothetical protein
LHHIKELGKLLIFSLHPKANGFLLKGLTEDGKSPYKEWLQLWGEFNTAWLSLFQKQKDILELKQPRLHLMTQRFIKKMVQDLINMCDTIEKDGLVDYPYGVKEDMITIGNILVSFWLTIELIGFHSCY